MVLFICDDGLMVEGCAWSIAYRVAACSQCFTKPSLACNTTGLLVSIVQGVLGTMLAMFMEHASRCCTREGWAWSLTAMHPHGANNTGRL